MLCVQVAIDGTLEAANPQPFDTSTCALVVLTPAELKSPFALSVSDAESIFVSAALLLVLGFTVRAIARTLHEETPHNFDKE